MTRPRRVSEPGDGSSRLEKLGHPELSLPLQGDPLGEELERRVRELKAPGVPARLDSPAPPGADACP
jgi:hypothetical protein